MGGLFSKKKPVNKVNQHDKAVLDLKVQRDKLKQYRKQCDQLAIKETELAKRLLKAGKKQQALLALKKKKYQEQLLSKTETQAENIQKMIDSIEFAQMEQKVFQSLREGTDVLKEINSQMSVDEIDNLMEETDEAIAYQNEIADALSGKLTQDDEDDVLEELASLEKDTLELPDAYTGDLPIGEPVRVPTKEKKQPTAQLA